ncbi:MAG: 4-hydroxy-tetrahydrodipicolinate reductase [Phycisphaerales bacterium]|nr:4-hydroxy-tetrahydrodipicolinate reductase [Phycisphaerales bacterium]MBT7171170.1 4-hydroxy-tetrahydrodipicolinate reductase [Phycisphaerales bacterium]
MELTQLGVIGAGGRMGRRIVALAVESEQFDVMAATEFPGSDYVGHDVGTLAGIGTFGLNIAESLNGHPDVVIDFSLPEGTVAALDVCRQKGVPMIIGTTGMTESQLAHLADCASEIPIVYAGNYSMGINLLTKLIEQAAKTLGLDYDIEVTESHHRFKKDAPSGTALMLAKAACDGRGVDLNDVAVQGRHGLSPRTEGEIGIHALRIGDTVGEHAVQFGNLGETITLSHSAHTRDTFVRGSLRAAKWIIGKKPGLYDMCDVLGL